MYKFKQIHFWMPVKTSNNGIRLIKISYFNKC